MQFYSHLSHASVFSTLSWATIRASPFWATCSVAARPRPTIGSWCVARRTHLNTHLTDRSTDANRRLRTPSVISQSTRLGAEAVDALFSEDAANMESRLICTSGSSIVLKPLMECVARVPHYATHHTAHTTQHAWRTHARTTQHSTCSSHKATTRPRRWRA